MSLMMYNEAAKRERQGSFGADEGGNSCQGNATKSSYSHAKSTNPTSRTENKLEVTTLNCSDQLGVS